MCAMTACCDVCCVLHHDRACVPSTNQTTNIIIIINPPRRMVERASTEGAIVEYGSDINTAKYASGFAEMTKERAWDLRHLATLPGSLLSKVSRCCFWAQTTGVTQCAVPRLLCIRYASCHVSELIHHPHPHPPVSWASPWRA